MVDYTVRVELHSASAADYDDLHKAMLDAKFYRAFMGLDGKKWALPTAEYAHSSAETSAFVVRDQVTAIVYGLKRWTTEPWILVSKLDGERAVRSMEYK